MATLPIIPLNQLTAKNPAACFALLSEKQIRTTRDGQTFFLLTWKDKFRNVTSTVWPDSPVYAVCKDDWAVGGFYRLQGVLLNHEKYGPQFELRDGRDVRPKDRDDGFKEADLIARSRFDSPAMFEELGKLVREEIKDAPVAKLVDTILAAHREMLERLPATRDRYHAFPGGWLEHTLSIFKSCLWLTDYYMAARPNLKPPLNRDLILAAAALHEIGRVAEWTLPDDPGLPPIRTIPGQLHGHLILARDVIREAAKTIESLSEEFVLLLEHVVLSYLTLPEWGSPRLPAIPEVLILHHADDLDAKIELYSRCLENDTSDGPFTNPDPLLKRPLLKSRTL